MAAINAVLTDFACLVRSSENPQQKSVNGKKDKKFPKRQDYLRSLVLKSKLEFDVHFQDFKDVYNTKVFMDNFQRPAQTDSKLLTYVTLEDVKDVVLYTSIYDIPKDFIKLFLSDQVDLILRALILYMQYFLEIFRVVMKRREAVNLNKLRHPISGCVETLWKETLSNLRFILSRDYFILLMGLNETAEFHHYNFTKKLSRRTRDLMLHQLLQIFARRVVQVVLLEKDNNLVEEEMDRLFCVGGTKVDRKKKYGLTQMDIDILEHNFTVPTLQSKSVLSKEFARPSRNKILKTIGKPPWLSREAPSYFLAIEMALAGGESRFKDANIRLGILGFERHDFDCMLNLESSHPDSAKSSLVSIADTSISNQGGAHRVQDKSVQLTGPTHLLPKRDDNFSYEFELKFLGRCENYNEYHMKIRKLRWIAFRKANSRVNYEPDAEQAHHKEVKKQEEEYRIHQEQENLAAIIEQKKRKALPSFYFSSTAKSDSEDDIFTSFQEGIYNEQVKRGRLKKKRIINDMFLLR